MTTYNESSPAPFNAELFRKYAQGDGLLAMMANGKPDAYLEALFNSEVRENSVALRKWTKFVRNEK
jgi:hypothetical protein